MNLTPTDKGAGIAGIALAGLGWFTLFKTDHIFEACHLRWKLRDKIFNWITKSYATKSLTLLITEIVNFGVHGITNPASVLFAIGSTIVNTFMIFVGLPFHQRWRREKGVAL